MPVNAAFQFHSMHAARFAQAQLARCVACGTMLPQGFTRDAQAPDPYPCCHAVACRMVVSRREEMGEAGFKHYLQMQARHKQHLAAAAEAARARKLAEVAQNAQVWSALCARLPAALAPEPLRLLLPSGPRQTRRLSLARRERYRAHLLQIVDEARGLEPAVPNGAEPAATAASTLPGQLCALCGGGCCTRGGDKAYLGAAAMRRFMDARPELSPDQVVAAYLGRVAARTQAGSCINHTAQGCSLPTDMRSDTCNRFSCESLARLQAAQRGTEPVHAVLVVRRKQDHWHRNEPGVDNAVNAHAVLGETGTRRFAHSVAPLSAPD